MSNNKIFVTRSSLPPLDEYIPLLQELWDSRHLTNSGAFHQQLEKGLKEYLKVPNISLFSSGTAALFAALKLSDLKGEVITTPFTFIATANSLKWCGLDPVFVDIDPNTANISPAEIEGAITPKTCAILAVHCYGQACDTGAIAKIAKKHNLKVIYDAAHAFGVEDEHGSILNSGDFSALSFHATKVFNTAEGGALICHDEETKKRIDRFKDFGLTGETTAQEIGFNGKMSELSAALGVVQLRHIDHYISSRKNADQYYRDSLQNIPGIDPIRFDNLKKANYSYFPVRITERYPLDRDALYEKLKAYDIFTRRYFYPLMTDFVPYKGIFSNTPVAQKFASEVLCLPLYADLTQENQNRILDVLRF